MNGDLGKIYDEVIKNGNRLTAVETTQKLCHKENKGDINVLFTELRATKERPCVDHGAVKAVIGWHARWIFFIVSAIVLLGIKAVFR